MIEEQIQELVNEIKTLWARVEELEASERNNNYLGNQAGDFTTTELPNHGDYGAQTTDDEIQVNFNGTIRAISTAAL